MIKTLIVDDEKLVRKGMISIMPWEKYGIEIVGDVNSGPKALEFLADNNVDLVITDISMPEMSGIELMKTAREKYSDIWFVLLTFHQDFEFIQEALRLGAIDYILKTSLEKEQLDDVLERITNRIKKEEDKLSKLEGSNAKQEERYIKTGLMITKAAAKEYSLEENSMAEWIASNMAIMVDESSWFVKCTDKQEQEEKISCLIEKAFDGWAAVKINNEASLELNVLIRELLSYKNRELFYDYNEEQNVYEFHRVDEVCKIVSKEAIEALRNKWSDYNIINDSEAFKAVLQDTKKLRPEAAVLEGIVYSALKEWQRFLKLLNIEYRFEREHNFKSWEELVCWLEDFRRTLRAKTMRPAYSQEINASVMKAIHHINNATNDFMKEEEVAKLVGMSRSYFSKAFRDIIGQSFNEFVLDLKIEKAKLQLAQTDKPIYLVAENVGYMNEKHFSRVFNKQTGILPSEYRNKLKEKKC